MYIRIYVYVCMVCACVESATRILVAVSYNGRRRSAPRGKKEDERTSEERAARELCEKFFLYITIHIHSYTYMFIKSNYRLRTIFIGSTIGIAVNASQRPVYTYKYAYAYVCMYRGQIGRAGRDKCVCMEEARVDGGWKGKRERTNNDRAGPMRVRFLRLKSCRYTKNENGYKELDKRKTDRQRRNEYKRHFVVMTL